MKERCRDGCRTSLLIAGVVLVPAIFRTSLPPCHPYITIHFMEMIFSTCDYYSPITILSPFLFTRSLYAPILNLQDFSFTCKSTNAHSASCAIIVLLRNKPGLV